MVEWDSLENRCSLSGNRGFESLSLRLRSPKLFALEKAKASSQVTTKTMTLQSLASYGGQGPLFDDPHYVYILRCSDESTYTGCTSNLVDRIKRHSNGQIKSTYSRLPVKLIMYHVFSNKYSAFNYEKYLKSGSGRAFLKRHLL